MYGETLLTRVLALSAEARLGESGQGVRRAPSSAQAATSPALLFGILVFVFARRSGCFCQALAFGGSGGRSGGSNVKRAFLLEL
jgi:hypothetical protein